MGTVPRLQEIDRADIWMLRNHVTFAWVYMIDLELTNMAF